VLRKTTSCAEQRSEYTPFKFHPTKLFNIRTSLIRLHRLFIFCIGPHIPGGDSWEERSEEMKGVPPGGPKIWGQAVEAASKNAKAIILVDTQSSDATINNASDYNNLHWVRKLDAETGKYIWFNPSTNEVSRSYRPPYANKTKHQQHKTIDHFRNTDAMPSKAPPPSIKIPPPAFVSSDFGGDVSTPKASGGKGKSGGLSGDGHDMIHHQSAAELPHSNSTNDDAAPSWIEQQRQMMMAQQQLSPGQVWAEVSASNERRRKREIDKTVIRSQSLHTFESGDASATGERRIPVGAGQPRPPKNGSGNENIIAQAMSLVSSTFDPLFSVPLSFSLIDVSFFLTSSKWERF
jgi:hypothetical protein